MLIPLTLWMRGWDTIPKLLRSTIYKSLTSMSLKQQASIFTIRKLLTRNLTHAMLKTQRNDLKQT
nr:hypothetical protein [Rubripirellula amarantea]